MRQHGLVHVHRALRLAGRAAGEVQERHILRLSRRDRELFCSALHQRSERVRARGSAHGVAVDQQNVLEPRQGGAPLGNPAPGVQRRRGHQHPAIADGEALLERLRPERGEEGAHDAGVLQRAECGDIELGHAAAQDEDALALTHVQPAQHVGEAIAEAAEVVVRKIARPTVLAEPAQREVRGTSAARMAIDRLVGDVEPAPAGQSVERPARRGPRELRPRALVVDQIGDDFPPTARLRNGLPAHRVARPAVRAA